METMLKKESSYKSIFADVPKAPEDQMFGLSAAFRSDGHAQKVDLGPGTYRDDDGKPWVLPIIKKVDTILRNDIASDHEYLPIAGLEAFVTASQRLLLGSGSRPMRERRIASVQTLSGTGALSLAARFLKEYHPLVGCKKVFVSDPAYVNHLPLLHNAQLETDFYTYYSELTKGLDFDGMIHSLRSMPESSIVLLHACAHNPTGVDPTKDQWKEIARVMKRKNLLPFFDSAYQGFASGDLSTDAWSIRHFVELDFDAVLVAQSYAKNFGLYGERVGCLHIVASNSGIAMRILTQLQRLQRVSVSTPPAYGARLVAMVLADESLFREWQLDLITMSDRIKAMRRMLQEELELATSRGWHHITEQIGMFCYTGLNAAQVRLLRDRSHIYMARSGRINISGLNSSNVAYVAKAIAETLRTSRL